MKRVLNKGTQLCGKMLKHNLATTTTIIINTICVSPVILIMVSKENPIRRRYIIEVALKKLNNAMFISI